ncbi:MAG TPA: poly-gamma-glutamate synthase PgsB [Anaerolineales bacterium]|nr:poly-gamma-glutamate synthase PgsB [Anaerolineales bacterium]
MYGIIVLGLTLLGVIISWWIERENYEKQLDKLKIRIYVNGIRGKSTVTRLIAGVLREAGIQTLAKTTGSAAMVLLPDGDEIPIHRRSSATIMELFNIAKRYLKKDTEAIVFETMALFPANQTASQELLVKGNINVITNVREDHQDVMGESLEEIADTMSLIIPNDGVLITAEDRLHLRERLTKNAAERGSRMVYADPSSVTEKDLAGFNYLSFRENISIGLAVAEILGIPRSTAMRGMWNARPDVGVVNIQRTTWKEKEIVWIPLFAVNDRESTIISVDALKPYYRENATRIGILNNRYDRADRAMRFANIAAKDLNFDYWITFGAYESQVTDEMLRLGVPRERIINMGFSVNPTLEQIFDKIATLIEGEQGVLIGLVNIHTPQAELLLEYFHHRPDSPVHVHEDEAWKYYRPRMESVKERMIGHLAERD